MMTAEQLKASILQLAMQGKLVEQRPEEGTGEELYQKIQEEKKRLIKEGIIKPDKQIIETIDDTPADIPETWKWVRFGELFDIGSAIRIHQTDWKSEGIPFFRGRELVRLAKTGEPDAEIFITQELYEKNKAKGGVPKKGDLLVSAVGTIGKVYIVKGTKPFYYKDAYILRFNNVGNLYSKYFQYVIESPFEQDYIKEGSMGTTVAQLTIMKAKRMLCPLPPLAEQKRIVAKIEELMPFVEQYAAASTKLNTLNTTFPDMIKKSILQEAVQGKLVPQDPNDEPASVLLKKIAEEKRRLIKEGKIKKQKALPEITEDEIPFDIPDSWEWVRLGDLTELITKGSSPKWQGVNYVNEGLLFVTSENVGVEELLWSNKKYVDFRFNDISPRSILKKGDLLTNIVGASIGRTAVYDLDEVANINQAVCLIRLINQDFAPYILMHLNSPIAYRIMMADKVETARPNISLTNIAEFLVPLPPLKEQERIIEKLRNIDKHIKAL